MTRRFDQDHGRTPTDAELRELERLATLRPAEQRRHPSALAADPAQLTHVNTYGELPTFYVDRAFTCRHCGKREIWRARDQKWYCEVAKGHIEAKAVACGACRRRAKGG